jgi:hypothetical protein
MNRYERTKNAYGSGEIDIILVLTYGNLEKRKAAAGNTNCEESAFSMKTGFDYAICCGDDLRTFNCLSVPREL